MSENDFNVLENIVSNYDGDSFEIPTGKKYGYISIVGKSIDGIGQKLFKYFLTDGNKLYFITGKTYSASGISTRDLVAELTDEQKGLMPELFRNLGF